MKLAYLISRYPSFSHTFILREVLQLRKMDFDIHIASINNTDISPDKIGKEEKDEIERTYYVKERGALGAVLALLEAVFLHPVGFFSGLFLVCKIAGFDIKRLVYHFFYFIEAAIVGLWMKKLSLSHLHVHFANPASTVGLIASRIFPITYSMTVHGPDEFYDVSLNALAEKIQGAKFICCIGYYAQSQLMKLSNHSQWEKFEICPLGVDPEVYTPNLQRNGRNCDILSVGRLVATKGQYVLIDAVEKLVKSGHPIKLRLIGDGPERKNLENEVVQRNLQEHISLLGALNQDQVREAYKSTDIFVLSSFAEGIPITLMEAMSMEIPCVSTFVNGIPEIIRDGMEGLLVVPSDSEAMAEAISQLIEKPEFCQKLGKAGRQRVLEKYNLPYNTQRMAEIFKRRLCEKERPS